MLLVGTGIHVVNQMGKATVSFQGGTTVIQYNGQTVAILFMQTGMLQVTYTVTLIDQMVVWQLNKFLFNT
jgi:hypothetical protein